MEKNTFYITEQFKQESEPVQNQSDDIEVPCYSEEEIPSEVHQAIQTGLSRIKQNIGNVLLDEYLKAKQEEARKRLFGDT